MVAMNGKWNKCEVRKYKRKIDKKGVGHEKEEKSLVASRRLLTKSHACLFV